MMMNTGVYKRLFNFFFFLISVVSLYGQDTILLEIKTGDNPEELSWVLLDENGVELYTDEGGITEPNFQYRYNLVVDAGLCTKFEIRDKGENGIGSGGYYGIRRNLFWYVNFKRDFGAFNYHIMGDCIEGKNCDVPMPVNSLLMYHPGSENFWYTITPDVNSFYDIKTCINFGVDTRMYIYDVCPDELVSNPEGALAFSNDLISCSPGSGFINFLFEAGKQYFIRVEMVGVVTPPVVAITFESRSENPGCMDPLSCNFNPFANKDDGSCIFDIACRPDLAIGKEKFENSIRLDKYTLEDTCLLDEKCVTGLGERDIVRFTTAIYNVGGADYIVGYPNTNSGGFSNDNCHKHWHQLGYAEYILYGGAGQPEPIGFKNGFCVLDINCDSGNTKYTCDYMGITAGCYDEYTAELDCQWIDVTDVEDGDYTMVARINWNRFPDARGMDEVTYENNWAQVCINLDRSSGELVMTKNPGCPEYRDCFDVAFGPSTEDCNGVCGGLAHYGDFNQDGEVSNLDVADYLSEIGNGVFQLTPCADLDGNGTLSVYDACLLDECLGTYNGNDPWHQHCLFPAGIENGQLEAQLSLMEVDLAENAIVIGYQSLNSDIKAFQFKLAGIDKIISVEDKTGTGLVPQWSRELDVYTLIKSSYLQAGPEQPLVKIVFNEQIDNEICLSEVVDIVNSSYQRIIGQQGAESCFFYSGVQDFDRKEEIEFYPNPVTGKLFFDTKGKNGVRMQLMTLDGIVVTDMELASKSELDVSNFDTGLYFIHFSNGTNSLLHISPE